MPEDEIWKISKYCAKMIFICSLIFFFLNSKYQLTLLRTKTYWTFSKSNIQPKQSRSSSISKYFADWHHILEYTQQKVKSLVMEENNKYD